MFQYPHDISEILSTSWITYIVYNLNPSVVAADLELAEISWGASPTHARFAAQSVTFSPDSEF
jgi:hypothetical protein